ncbi:MAG: type II toxin-antitoxin system PrlF family antitoxin [Gemmatimonas sp.]
MYDSKLTSKGQITVPKVVREALALHPGDRIRFIIRDDGTVTVEAESVDLKSLRGVMKSGGRHVSVEQMREAIRRGASGAEKRG